MRTRSASTLGILFLIPLLLVFSTQLLAQSEGAATVTTDRLDYQPGDTVVVTGMGWLPGETVQLVFDETPSIHPPDTLFSTASHTDSGGAIYNNEYVIESHDLGQAFTLTATGLSSGLTAQAFFTDAAINLYENSLRTIERDAFAWGSMVFSTVGVNTSTRCYRVEWLRPDGSAEATHFLAAGTSTRNDSLPIPADGPSGVWRVRSSRGSTAVCATATYTEEIADSFDVAHAVIIGAVLTGSVGGDGYVDENQPTTVEAGGIGDKLQVSGASPGGKTQRSYLRFELSGTGISGNVSSAIMRLKVENPPPNSRRYLVQRVTGAWRQDSITWNNKPGVRTTPRSSLSTGTTDNALLRWGVTADVDSFVKGQLTNYGWAVRDSIETGTEDGRFYATEKNLATDKTFGPVLLVEYVCAPPVVTVNPVNDTTCSGSMAGFSSSATGDGSLTLQWQVSTDGGSSWSNTGGGTSPLTFTAATGANGYRYRAIFTSACGADTSDAAALKVDSVSCSITPSTASICAGDSVTLTSTPAQGSGSYSHHWSTGETSASIVAKTASVYTDTVTDNITGCQSICSAEVTVNPLPLSFNVTGGGSYCAGGTGVPVGLGGSQAGVKYQLRRDGSDVGSPVQGTGDTLAFGLQTVVGTYKVLAIDTSTACASPMADSAGVSIRAISTAPAINSPICEGSTSVSGTSTEADGTVIEVTFNGTGALTTTVTTGVWTVNGVSPLAAGVVVSATATAPGKCVNAEPDSVTVTPLPFANAGPDTSVCGLLAPLAGSSPGSGTGTWSTISAPSGGVIVFGAEHDSASTATASVAGTYLLGWTVTAGGCPRTDTVEIVFHEPPVCAINPADPAICAGDSVVLKSSPSGGTGPYTHSWSTGETTDSIVVKTAGVYTDTVTDAAGCTHVCSTEVKVNPLPVVYTVTGGGSFCAGGSGMVVGLNGSETGVSYQLFRNDTSTGLPLPGTDNPLNFGSQVLGGTYTVLATRGLTGCQRAMNNSVTVIVNQAPEITTAAPDSQAVQYSDRISAISVIVSDADAVQSDLTISTKWKKNGAASFTAGLPAPLALNLTDSTTVPTATRTWSITGKAPAALGVYTIRVITTDGACKDSVDVKILVKREDAVAYCNTPDIASVNPNSCSATLTLTATIKDISAVPLDPATDAYAGDIRKARVKFLITGGSVNDSAYAPVGLVNPLDSLVGSATVVKTVDLNNSECSTGGLTLTVVVVVESLYTNAGVAYDPAVCPVTVEVPGKDKVTGGGYLVMGNQTSAGKYKGKSGAKTNFGFTMKYNKSGKNIQGQTNILIRAADDSLYQIKSNAINTLNVSGNRASFSTKANISNLTNPLIPKPMQGNLTLMVDLFDSNKTGQIDSIAITLLDNLGGILYSSEWNGVKTKLRDLRKPSGGGNISIMSGVPAMAGLAFEEESLPTEYSLLQNFPNPFNPTTTITYTLPEPSEVTIRIYNILGEELRLLTNEVQDAGYRQIEFNASSLATGVYFYRLEAVSTTDPSRSFSQLKKMLLVK